MTELKELNIDELEFATGGTGGIGEKEVTVDHYCTNCKKTTKFIVFTGTRGRCKECGLREDNL